MSTSKLSNSTGRAIALPSILLYPITPNTPMPDFPIADKPPIVLEQIETLAVLTSADYVEPIEMEPDVALLRLPVLKSGELRYVPIEPPMYAHGRLCSVWTLIADPTHKVVFDPLMFERWLSSQVPS